MNTVNTNLAILIANVSNREQSVQRLDKIAVHANTRSCHDAIVRIMDKNEGTLVRNTDDNIIGIFSSADYAANAAINMNKELNSNPLQRSDNSFVQTALSVHVGIHYGPIIMLDSDDVYGDAVNIASQLVELAQKEYIFTTGSTVEMLSPELQELAYFVKTDILKCNQKNIELFELNWKQYH